MVVLIHQSVVIEKLLETVANRLKFEYKFTLHSFSWYLFFPFFKCKKIFSVLLHFSNLAFKFKLMNYKKGDKNAPKFL